MKNIYFLSLLWIVGLFTMNVNTSRAQLWETEGLNMPGGWNSWTNPPAINSALGGIQTTGGKITLITRPFVNRYHTVIHAAVSGGDVTGGTYAFLFTSGPPPPPPTNNPFQNKWANVTVLLNTIQTYTKEGASNNSITLTNDKWYTMNFENTGYTDTRAIFMETTGAPVTISSVTQSPIAALVITGSPVTVTVTISATKSAQEIVYLRYSTNDFATSKLVEVSFTGTSGTADIPGTDNTESTTVKYYVFSTTKNIPTPDYDLYTINYDDNGGSFYSYRIDNTPPTASTLSPANNSTNVAINSDLQITFTENVTKGTGNIVLKKADNTTIETIDVNSGLISISANVATINPTNNLDYFTGYYIQIDNGAFKDFAPTPWNYAGISNASTWNFQTSADLIGWANLQSPSTATVVKNSNIANIYMQVYKTLVTDQPGRGTAISAWLGINSTDTDPASWPESAWVPATFNKDDNNNDEYKAIITGSGLAAGTYYYASRFKYNNNPYQYGGFNSGFWDGSLTKKSGVLTVQDYPGTLITSPASAITVIPPFPTVNDNITILYDASLGNGVLKNLLGNLIYTHTGITTPTGDWQNAPTWGDNAVKYTLTYGSGNSYSLNIPNVFDYYNATIGTDIQKMSFIFRNFDKSLVGKTAENKDFFVQLYPANLLQVRFNYPTKNSCVFPGDQISVEAQSNEADQIKLYVDGSEVYSVIGLKLNFIINAGNTPGNHEIKAVAIKGVLNVEKTISYFITAEPVVEALPNGMKDGINYIDGQTATLVLFAPEKQFVHLIGDFNNWIVDNNYLLKRSLDNTRYWITISGLEPGKEYGFQYLIDGKLRIADPYTEKVLDPDNDKNIPFATYPNLISYPFGKTEEIASVLQTNQTPYTWQVPNFIAPSQNQIVTYELHIRDFTSTGDINGVLSKLDYLKTLGINAIELMPINEFEGNDSWGYNPDFYFAPDKAYGTKQAYKQFIDECHKKGIAVLIDMVLNHSFNQSPMVRMYFDAATGNPAPNNPWFNTSAPHGAYSWGSDFNHDSPATRAFVDRVNAYWLTEYNIDGIRFDFTKGFTQKVSTGDAGLSANDPSRIYNLERMYDAIKVVKPSAYVILEHLADNSEELELANHGIMLWANMNTQYNDALMGWSANLSSAYFKSRSFTYANLVSYAESHDEERNAFKAQKLGNSTQAPTYDVKDKATYVHRTAMNEAFNLFMPGPRMLWQFEELAYDYSIDENGRTGRKPIKWDYFDDTDRKALYTKMAKMIQYRIENPTIFKWQIDYFEDPEEVNTLKRIRYIEPDAPNEGRINAVIIGNFGVTSGNILPGFGQDGKSWYDIITGLSIGVQDGTSLNQFTLAPGELRVYIREELNPSYTVRPPLGDNAKFITDEDISKTFAPGDFKFYSVDGRTMAGIRIAKLPTAGVLQYNGIDAATNIDYPDITKLVFKPALNQNGTDNSKFIYQLKDNSTPTSLYSDVKYTVSFDVNAINDAPVITGQSALSTNENKPLTINLSDLTVTDVDNTFPNGFNLTVLAGTNYTFSGNTITPVLNYSGTLTVHVQVNDGAANSDVYNLTIKVNDSPVITGQSALSTNEDIALTINLTNLIITDADNAFPTDFSLTVRNGLNYSVSGSTITPALNFNGTLTVPVLVNDGAVNSNVFNLRITVVSVNDAPVITGQKSLSTTQNIAITLKLTDLNVTDVDNTYPTGFSLTIQTGVNYSVSGTIITPALNYSGLLTIPVQVYDGVSYSEVYSLTITVNTLPLAAGPIAGTTYVCAGKNNVSYSVEPINNATTYLWNYSGSGAVINGNGNQITINFASTATNGNLTVKGTNTSGSGAVSSNYPIIINRIASDAGVITGPAVLCAGSNNVLYSAGATNTTWSFSGTGATISSNGNSIAINFAPISTSGVLTVKGSSVCSSVVVTGNYAISVRPLPSIGAINGLTIVNAGTTNVIYSTNSTNATSISWSYTGTGTLMSGTGGSRIVSFSKTATSGNLTVNAINVCGSSPGIKSITVVPLAKTTQVVNEIHLSVNGENYPTDETSIVFNNEASPYFDVYDSEKLINQDSGIMRLSTQTQDNVPMTINTLPNPNSKTIITLAFQSDKSGKYTLKVDKINIPVADVELYMEDTKTRSIVNLSQTKTYTFTAQPSDAANRFRLYFVSISSSFEYTEQNDFVIYSFKKEVFVMKTTSSQAQVMIYDLQGRMIKNAQMNDNFTKFSIEKTGIYIVKMVSDKATLSKEVIIVE